MEATHHLDASVIERAEQSVAVTKILLLVGQSSYVPIKRNDLVTNALLYSTMFNALQVEMHVAHTLNTERLPVAGMVEEDLGSRMFID